MGKDSLAYVTSWQQGLCSILWTLASLSYGMTGLARWPIGSLHWSLLKRGWWPLSLLLSQSWAFGLFLLLDSTSALTSGTYSFLLKCPVFSPWPRLSFPYLRNLPFTISFFVMSFSEWSLVLYVATFHRFPILPTLWQILEPFHPRSELKVVEEYKLSTCVCLPIVFALVFFEASYPFWQVREGFDFLCNYLTKHAVYSHSPN